MFSVFGGISMMLQKNGGTMQEANYNWQTQRQRHSGVCRSMLFFAKQADSL